MQQYSWHTFISKFNTGIQLLLDVETLVAPVFFHFVDHSILHGNIYFFLFLMCLFVKFYKGI